MKNILLPAILFAVLAACQSPASNTWSSAYGGADKAHDHELLRMRDTLAARFDTFTFTDPSGVRMAYNLYAPPARAPGRTYPLVMFIADASTAGKGVKAPLMQGWGGIIWASDAVQAETPAYVLVPAYDEKAVDDQWNTSAQVGITANLVRDIIKNHPIDAKRVYATGQSMGGMIAFYLNAVEPELFAASMFVGSQWDIKVLQPLTRTKFIYTVSAGDEKASGGMHEVIELMRKNNVPYGEVQFSATLPQDAQNAHVSALLAQNKPANFIRFDAGSVLPPQGTEMKAGDHMYSFDYAYKLTPARQWLLSQGK